MNVDRARFEALLNAAQLTFDTKDARARHGRSQRLRATHAAEASGENPFALEIAAEMFAAHFDECFVRALDDALAADVDPRAGRHLAVHHQTLAIEFVEMFP